MIATLTKFIIDEFNKNDLVNTISIVQTYNLDSNKENIYPLVNIDLQETDPIGDSVVAVFEITIVQQRNSIKKVTDSKLLSDSNYLDNINETHFIAMKFINKMQFQNNIYNIEVDNISNVKILKDALDGVQFTINLSIPNNIGSC
jgi:hypothetical protein